MPKYKKVEKATFWSADSDEGKLSLHSKPHNHLTDHLQNDSKCSVKPATAARSHLTISRNSKTTSPSTPSPSTPQHHIPPILEPFPKNLEHANAPTHPPPPLRNRLHLLRHRRRNQYQSSPLPLTFTREGADRCGRGYALLDERSDVGEGRAAFCC